jgi:DNA invertase Pin-like site-specific DNA recombinase
MEPAYHYILKKEFKEQGTTIRTLNDRGDGSAEGELTNGIIDQISRFERLKTAERTRRGKLQRARGEDTPGPPGEVRFRSERQEGWLRKKKNRWLP